jgi:hypothetical protein
MQTPDGKRLRSNILGLMYCDSSTGDAVLIAQLQDSEGQLISDNQVLYSDAFDGVKADVRYTYRRDGLEQDVILREQPPAPEAYGFNPQTTELEVFTDFIDSPAASVAEVASDEPGVEPDQQVAWGATILGRGKAFNLGSQDSTATVTKRYVTIQGRQFLLEKVQFRDIKSPLSKLPEQAANTHRLPTWASKNPQMPKVPLAQTDARPIRIAWAAATAPDRGYVLDYVTTSANYTNYTFQGDTTYYVSGNLRLLGTNTFEGGTVIKYAANASILEDPQTTSAFSPQVVFKTSAYFPVVLTAKDDNTVGESISGSTGSPSGYYANPALYLPVISAQQISGVRISYAQMAIAATGTPLTLNDAQFVKCCYGVEKSGCTLAVNNALFVYMMSVFYLTGNNSVVVANQVTFNNALYIASPAGNYPSGSYIQLTNCILANVTNVAGTIYGGNNGFYRTPIVGFPAITNAFYPFQSVGGGNYYLATNSPFHNAGTPNIDPAMLASLRQKTTWPPIAFTNRTFAVITNFPPQAARDTNVLLDLGYHYDPLDYAFGGCCVNSNMTFTAGTAVGWFRTASGWYRTGQGINMTNRQICTFSGTATAPCYWVRLNTVQENDLTAGYGAGGLTSRGDTPYQNGSIANASGVTAQFLRCSCMAGDCCAFRDDWGILIGRFTDCEFYSVAVGGYISSYFVTNCLFDRSSLGMWQGVPGSQMYVINSTFHGGYAYFTPTQTGIPVTVINSAFDGTSLDIEYYGANASYASYNHNAYTNSSNPFPFSNHDVVVANFNWQSSWFGNYYLPPNSPLINRGSTTADQVGLYHFTTQTNQVPENNSVVDIGYHYVATDVNGNPLDTDGDGVPDYLEDTNGNGIFDAGDLSNWLVSPYNGLTSNGGLKVFTPLK